MTCMEMNYFVNDWQLLETVRMLLVLYKLSSSTYLDFRGITTIEAGEMVVSMHSIILTFPSHT